MNHIPRKFNRGGLNYWMMVCLGRLVLFCLLSSGVVGSPAWEMNNTTPGRDQFWSSLENWARDNRSTVDQLLDKAGNLARGMGSLQGKLNIDHRDISRHLNNFAINLLPEVHWKTNFTALEFPEMPTIEDVFPVLRYNCSLEYYGRTNKTLLCGVQNSWQDLVSGIEYKISNTFDFLVTNIHRSASWYLSPLSQAVNFLNNLLPAHWPFFEERTIIGDYWRYGRSNKTLFGDFWPDFEASDHSNRTMGLHKMFNTD